MVVAMALIKTRETLNSQRTCVRGLHAENIPIIEVGIFFSLSATAISYMTLVRLYSQRFACFTYILVVEEVD